MIQYQVQSFPPISTPPGPSSTRRHPRWVAERRRPGVVPHTGRPEAPPRNHSAPRVRIACVRRSTRLVWPHGGGWRGGTRTARAARRRRRGGLPKGRHAPPTARPPRATSLPAQIRTPPPRCRGTAGTGAPPTPPNLARARAPPRPRSAFSVSRRGLLGRVRPPPEASRRGLCRALGGGPRAWSPRGAERGSHPHHARAPRRVRDAPARATHAHLLSRPRAPPRPSGLVLDPPSPCPPHATSATRVSGARFLQRRCATPLGGVPSVASPAPRAPPRPALAPACAARRRALPRQVQAERGEPLPRGRRLGSRQLRGVPVLAKPIGCCAPCGLPTDRPAPSSACARARHGVVGSPPIARWPAAAATAASSSFHRHGAGWERLTVGRRWRRLLVGGGSSTLVEAFPPV